MAGRRSGRVDLRRALDVVDPLAHDGDGEFLPQTALEALADLIGTDLVTFQSMDARRRLVTAQGAGEVVGPESDSEALDHLFWQGFWDCLACCYPQRSGDYTTVTRLSDFYTRRALNGLRMGAYLTASGARHEMVVPLPPDGEQDRRILLFRDSGRDFTDDDLLLLQLLRPHLLALHLRRRAREEGAADLTPRQVQILTLVAGGCTNTQVARALGISEATVRKHLEHTYARLNVSGRAAAVAKVVPLVG